MIRYDKLWKKLKIRYKKENFLIGGDFNARINNEGMINWGDVRD